MRVIAFAAAVLLLAAAVHAAPCADSTTEPDVPTYSFSLDGAFAYLTVEFDRSTVSSQGFTTFKVLFGGDDSCDFEAPIDGAEPSPVNDWAFTSLTSSCTTNYTMNTTISKLIGQCGFVRDEAREPGRVHFINRNITFESTQTRTDLRTPYTATRSTAFTVDISIASNVTVSSENVNVFGNALRFSLLGEFKVEVIDNFAVDANTPYIYQVSGTVVTSVQEPYVLSYDTGNAAAVTPAADFDTLSFQATPNTTCDGTPADCTQEWTFAVNLSSLACGNKAETPVPNGFSALSDQVLTSTYIVGCQAQFTGECAPTFDPSTGISFTLTSSDFCPSFDTIELSAEIVPYAFGIELEADDSPTPSATQLWGSEDDSTAVASSQTAQTVNSAYRVETLFTFEATIYLEARAWVVNNAATIATAVLSRIVTKPVGRTAITVYSDEDNSGTQNVGDTVADTSLIVSNTGFGDDAQDYDHSRARAEFELNANTYDRSNTGDATLDDAAQTGTIEVTIVVTFAQGNNNAFGEDEYSLVSSLLADTNERGTSTTIGFRSAAPAPSSPAGGSSSALGSSALTVGAVAVAGVAIIALVAVVVLRRPARTAKPMGSNLNGLPQTSSSANLNVEAVPLEQVQATYTDERV